MSDQQAGWYPDPADEINKLRYWDGTQWTNDFADVPSQSTIAQPAQPGQPGQPAQPGQAVQPGQPVQTTPLYLQPQPAQPANVLAIVSLICAIAGFFIPVVTSIAAVILGALALKRPEQKGLAIAGLTLGILFVLFWIVIVVLFIDFITSSTYWY